MPLHDANDAVLDSGRNDLRASISISGDNSLTAPAGWNLIRSDINGHQSTLSLYWHLISSAEPPNYTRERHSAQVKSAPAATSLFRQSRPGTPAI